VAQSTAASFIRLARPHQWAKSIFVIIGPAYGIATGKQASWSMIVGLLGAVIAFCLAASACYVLNDIRDREADKVHPRKRLRPIASGAISVPLAMRFAAVLAIGALIAPLLVWVGGKIDPPSSAASGSMTVWLLVTVVIYIVNTTFYSMTLKNQIVLDVISLASGFVLRVMGGCAATGVPPSLFLLNVTFFLSMFLAFGKRLAERQTLGADAAAGRAVQAAYTNDFLRMAVVVTGVATLVTYAGYVEGHGPHYDHGFNLLWLTLLPATYGLLRCMVLLDTGRYDDPTEMATHDRPMQLAVALFALITVLVMWGAPRPPV